MQKFILPNKLLNRKEQRRLKDTKNTKALAMNRNLIIVEEQNINNNHKNLEYKKDAAKMGNKKEITRVINIFA